MSVCVCLLLFPLAREASGVVYTVAGAGLNCVD